MVNHSIDFYVLKVNLAYKSSQSQVKSKCLLSHTPNFFSALKFLWLGSQHLRSRRHSSEKQWITPFPPFAQNGVPLMFPYNSRRDLDSPQYNGWVQLAWLDQLSPSGSLFKGCLVSSKREALEKRVERHEIKENTYLLWDEVKMVFRCVNTVCLVLVPRMLPSFGA